MRNLTATEEKTTLKWRDKDLTKQKNALSCLRKLRKNKLERAAGILAESNQSSETCERAA